MGWYNHVSLMSLASDYLEVSRYKLALVVGMSLLARVRKLNLVG